MKRSDSIIRANLLLVLVLALLWPAQWLVQGSGLFDDYVVRIMMLAGIWITAAVSLQLINGISGQFSLGHAGFVAVGAYATAYPSLHYSQHLTKPLALLAFFLILALVLGIVTGMIWSLYMLLRFSRRWSPAAPVVLTLALLAWVVADFRLASGEETIPPYLVWSWGIHQLQAVYSSGLGYLLPLGDRIIALLPARLVAMTPAGLLTALSYLILLLGGGACAAAAGLLVGVPALRLKGDYLAIATLGFAEIVRVLLESSDSMGGALGLNNIPEVQGFAWIFGIAAVTTFVVWRLVRSARGRAMLAVREDEIAAASVGIDPARSKVLAFVTGAFFAGVAGVMFAHHEGYITPGNFGFMRSIELVVIVTLAGSGSISGTIVVAALLAWLPEQLRSFQEYRMILYSLILIVMMLLRPNGILGSRELFALRRPARKETAT